METWNKSWEIASEQKWAGQDGKEAIVMLESRTPIKISQGNIWEEDQGQVGPDHRGVYYSQKLSFLEITI